MDQVWALDLFIAGQRGWWEKELQLFSTMAWCVNRLIWCPCVNNLEHQGLVCLLACSHAGIELQSCVSSLTRFLPLRPRLHCRCSCCCRGSWSRCSLGYCSSSRGRCCSSCRCCCWCWSCRERCRSCSCFFIFLLIALHVVHYTHWDLSLLLSI